MNHQMRAVHAQQRKLERNTALRVYQKPIFQPINSTERLIKIKCMTLKDTRVDVCQVVHESDAVRHVCLPLILMNDAVQLQEN